MPVEITDQGPQKTLRIVLLSCAGAPFSAEICSELQRDNPHVLAQIVGVVLSAPKIDPINKLPFPSKIKTLLKDQGVIGLLDEAFKALAYRCKHASITLRRRIRSALMPKKAAVEYTRIEELCEAKKLDVHMTRSIQSPETIAYVKSLEPDLIIMATFHHILKKNIIDIPKIAVLNIHPSYLPYYRGPDPINAVLRDKALETGVTIHWVDEGIDTGDIVTQQRVQVPRDVSEKDLRFLLASVAAKMIPACLNMASTGTLTRQSQRS